MKQFDLFQSYSHTDNSNPKNWAKDFHDTLKSRLEVITPPDLRFNTFLDERNQDCNNLPGNIVQALDQSRFLVVIYSPAYLKSEWCRLERAYFLKSATKDNVFKVVKYHTDRIKTPDELMTQIEYRFYKLSDGIPMELDLSDEEYKKEMNRLAHNIIDYLDRNKEKDGKKIFLAETEPDSWASRVNLSNELNSNNARVYPSELISDPRELQIKTRELMTQCSLSIHIMGPKAVNSERSIEEIQLSIAKEVSRENNLEIKVWIPKNISHDQELMKIVLSDDLSGDRYDVTIGSFEKFKSNVLSSISARQ
jgi:hypothetical protein